MDVCVEMGHPQKAGIRATGKPDRPDLPSLPASSSPSKEDVVTLKAGSEKETVGWEEFEGSPSLKGLGTWRWPATQGIE